MKAVIFDWGGVLIDEPTEGLLKYCAKSFGLRVDEFKEQYFEYEVEFQKGMISERELWEKIAHVTIKDSVWEKGVREVFKAKPKMIELVCKLKEKGYKIGFLSNTEIPALRYFFEEFDSLFDAKVFSCVEGLRKPEKEIYERILNRLGVQAGEAVFIDDRRECVMGAEMAGLNAVRYNGYSKLISSLRELNVKY